jgi:hypothetical protein
MTRKTGVTLSPSTKFIPSEVEGLRINGVEGPFGLIAATQKFRFSNGMR